MDWTDELKDIVDGGVNVTELDEEPKKISYRESVGKLNRIAVTGAAGGVGIHVLVHLLRNTDAHIFVLDSFRHKGYHARFEEIFSTNPEWRGRVTIIRHDLSCALPKSVITQLGDIDVILHLAAMSDVAFSIENPAYTIRNNIESTLTMLEYAREYLPNLKLFLNFGTDEALGPVKKGEAHDESDPHRPSNAYSCSKAASEDLCYGYWRSYNLPLVLTRTENNYGQMQSPSKFPVMVQKWLQKGEKVIIHGNEKEIGTRFYIHSRNAADALLYIMNNLPVHRHKMGELDSPDIYHIVGEELVSNLELAQMIARLMGKELNYETVDFHRDNAGHDIHYGLKDNKLRPSGWKMPVSFEDSMLDTIKWQTEHDEWIS